MEQLFDQCLGLLLGKTQRFGRVGSYRGQFPVTVREDLSQHIRPSCGRFLQARLSHGAKNNLLCLPRCLGIAQALGQELLHSRSSRKPRQQADQFLALALRRLGLVQALPKRFGQSVPPLGMAAGDPPSSLFERPIR